MARLDNNINQMAKAINIAKVNLNRTDMATIFIRNEQTLQKLIVLYHDYVIASNECRDEILQLRRT